MNTITIRTDEACEMACVELNGKCIMMGNFWDFHSNCMGIREYGDFNSHTQLAMAISTAILSSSWRFKTNLVGTLFTISLGGVMIDILWNLCLISFATSLISASVAEDVWLYRKQMM